jgi:hypothetical protein
VKRTLLLLAAAIFALSLTVTPAMGGGGNPFCPPSWPVCPTVK